MTEAPGTRPSLLVRLRNPKDELAWNEFLELYGPLIRRLAAQRGLQAADAADLEQEVFRAVATAINRWDPDPSRGSFRGWLSRTARNLIVNLLTERKRHPNGTGNTGFHSYLERQPASDSEETLLFESEYRRELFDRAAERIQPEFRASTWTAFWETAVKGRDNLEVATQLGLSIGAVYIAKSRVMARLRREVERFEDLQTDQVEFPRR